MIRIVTNDIELNDILEIHKQCILETNSLYYETNVIKEWLSTITIENIKEQLDKSTWIVYIRDNILGFAQYSLKDKSIFQIQVHPNYQGKSIGKEIYKYIEDDFRKENTEYISIYSTLNAIPFYKSLGFEYIKDIYFPLENEKIRMIEMRKYI